MNTQQTQLEELRQFAELTQEEVNELTMEEIDYIEKLYKDDFLFNELDIDEIEDIKELFNF